jgi:16S rRNA (guanine527-N7)-methyltransferase
MELKSTESKKQHQPVFYKKRHAMNITQIAALLNPFLEQSLPPSQLDQISIYIDLLLRWNARINLTAIRHPEEIVTRHFGESFFLARHLFPNPCHPERSRVIHEADGAAESKDRYALQLPAPLLGVLPTPPHPPRVLDIGSGAGFPALPLKLWAPQIDLTLVESNHKKAAFLREVARALTLTDINVINDRAEVLAARPDFPRAEVVTLRAVEHFATILPQAVTFLAPNATLALLIGVAQVPHLTALTTLKWHPPIPIPQSHARVLSISVHE